MRISIFLNNDLESNIALNCLLPELAHHEFNLFFSEKVGSTKHQIEALQYLDFLETEFMLTALFPKLESQSNKGMLTFKQIGHQYGVLLKQLQEINSVSTLAAIRSFMPDLFISIRFGKIFRGQMLSIPAHGIINLHSAILPDYKGILGTLRSFIDEKNEIGSTIHFINDNTIDTGHILQINRQRVSSGKSVLWHIINLYPQAIAKLSEIINRVSQLKEMIATPQSKGGHYYTFPNEEDFNSLKAKGIPLFILSEYSELLSNFYQIDECWIHDELRKNGLPESF